MKRLIIAFILAFFLVTPAIAATSRALPIAYTERTFGNATRDYTSLQVWEDATDNDLVTAAKGEVLTCYPDSASYNQRVSISTLGPYINASYFRVIRAAAGYERQVVIDYTGSSDLFSTAPIYCSESYFGLYDMVVKNSSQYAAYHSTVFFDASVGGRVVGCVIGPSVNSLQPDTQGLYCRSSIAGSIYVVNTIFTGCKFANLTHDSTHADSRTWIYNCVSTASDRGMRQYGSGAINAKNTIIYTCTATTGGTVNQTTCLFTTGAGTVTFEADGYHLAAADTAAKDQGTDLSGDATFPFNDDIDGYTRPYGAAWDIGADEWTVAPSTGGAQIFWFQ